MKGERIVAEALSVLGMLVYGVMLQHVYSQLLNKPEDSWINQGKAWWVTRGSRKLEKRLRVYSFKKTATEPTIPARED